MASNTTHLTLLQVEQGCHATVLGLRIPYGYHPALAAGLAFSILFGLSFFSHTYQGAKNRSVPSCLFAVGAVGIYSLSDTCSCGRMLT